MGYPHTGSTLTDTAGRNVTRTGVSTNIIIQCAGNTVGAVSAFNWNEKRDIAKVTEIGTDGVIDSVPKSSTMISGSCTRTRFDNLRIASAFSRGFVHASAQRIPFDIVILDIFAASEDDADGFNGADNVITTVFKNCWINSLSGKLQSTDFVIVDEMGWDAETVYSYLGQNNNVVPAGNARQLNIVDLDAFERQADIGNRRGALDAAGLINAVDQFLL